MKKHLGFRRYDKYIGIRYDEPMRAINNRDHKLPLYDLRITKYQRDEFWKVQPFNLEIHDYFGNCDMCFWKPNWLLIKMMRENPGIEDWWIRQEMASNGTFKKEISFLQLQHIAKTQMQIDFPVNSEFTMECTCSDF